LLLLMKGMRHGEGRRKLRLDLKYLGKNQYF